MVSTYKSRQVLAKLIFSEKIKLVCINGAAASLDDCAALLNDLKAGKAVLSGFYKGIDKLCLTTA